MACTIGFVFPLKGQKEKTVTLNDVEVKAARVIAKADGRLYLPSETLKAASPTTLSLLKQLQMPGIRIDDIQKTVSDIRQLGSVQLRINGATATLQEVLSIVPKNVKSVDFIERPGLRYGEGTAYVINILTLRNDRGYTLGTELNHLLTGKQGSGNLFGTVNRKTHEWSAMLDGTYGAQSGTSQREQARYLFNDNTSRSVLRTGENLESKNQSSNLTLKYNFADSTNRVFQAKISAGQNHTPLNEDHWKVTDEMDVFDVLKQTKGHGNTYSADLYYHREWAKGSSLTLNAVASHIRSKGYSFSNEMVPVAYHTLGREWGGLFEAVFEYPLKRVTFTGGVNGSLNYTRNTYRNDVDALVNVHRSTGYAFADAKGTRGNLSYMAGVGLNNRRYHQHTYQQNHTYFRFNGQLYYTLPAHFSLSYTFTRGDVMSRIAQTSDVTIRKNAYEWHVGNPDLKPYQRTEHEFTLSRTVARWDSRLSLFWRFNPDCNMENYIRTPDNRFLYTQSNERGNRMFLLSLSQRVDIVPDKCSAGGYATAGHFTNLGPDYSHRHNTFNGVLWMQVYTGRFTLMGIYDSGWAFMEGERRSRQGSSLDISASYRFKNGSVSLVYSNPFTHSSAITTVDYLNQYVRKRHEVRSTDRANRLQMKFTYTLHSGKKFRDVERKRENRIDEMGVF